MAKKKVLVERYVEQVRDGSHYRGDVKIAGTKLDYELKFAVPISQLDDMARPNGPEEVRRIFQLTVEKEGVLIELTDEEYGFFFQMLVMLAVDFYNNPQTRDSNDGIIGMTVRGEGPLADMGMSTSIGVKSSGTRDFPPDVCEMLSAPKFGCALVP
jgi:hypothetical protein